jgi:hypothetical protein
MLRILISTILSSIREKWATNERPQVSSKPLAPLREPIEGRRELYLEEPNRHCRHGLRSVPQRRFAQDTNVTTLPLGDFLETSRRDDTPLLDFIHQLEIAEADRRSSIEIKDHALVMADR